MTINITKWLGEQGYKYNSPIATDKDNNVVYLEEILTEFASELNFRNKNSRPLDAPVIRKPADGWIDIKERLPEVGEEVIVYCPKCIRKVTALARYIRYEEATDYYWDNVYNSTGLGGNTHVMNSVTHWMPLPNKPE